MLQDLFLLVLASLAGSALGYNRDLSSWNPQETSVAEMADNMARHGMSPKPTDSPHPRFGFIAELKRDVGAETCGWLTDGRPFTCYNDWWTCTNSGTIRDCCFSTDCSTSAFYTACYDSTATECSGSNIQTNAYCCTSTQYPFCVTYHYSTTATPGSLFTVWGCGNTGFSGTSEMLPEDPVTSSAPVTTTESSTTTTSSTSSTPTSTSSTSTSTTPTPTPTPTSGGGGSSTPVGAIVGGTVGGLAVVGIIAVAAIFMFLRRKKNKPQTPDPNYAATGQPPQPPMSSYPGSPQPNVYNPHYSMAGYPPGAQTSPSPSNNPAWSVPTTTPPNDYNYAGYYPAPVQKDDQVVPQPQPTVNEAPAVNPPGVGNNRAELA